VDVSAETHNSSVFEKYNALRYLFLKKLNDRNLGLKIQIDT